MPLEESGELAAYSDPGTFRGAVMSEQQQHSMDTGSSFEKGNYTKAPVLSRESDMIVPQDMVSNTSYGPAPPGINDDESESAELQ